MWNTVVNIKFVRDVEIVFPAYSRTKILPRFWIAREAKLCCSIKYQAALTKSTEPLESLWGQSCDCGEICLTDRWTERFTMEALGMRLTVRYCGLAFGWSEPFNRNYKHLYDQDRGHGGERRGGERLGRGLFCYGRRYKLTGDTIKPRNGNFLKVESQAAQFSCNASFTRRKRSVMT